MDWSPVTDWLLSHGIRILIIIIVSYALYFILHRVVPRALRMTVRQAGKGKKATEELEKRITTLSHIFVGTGVTIIVMAATFMILSEIGINIAPLIAGFGVAGIAIGFGAQSLVRDILSGIFILIENQYAVGDWVTIAGIGGGVEEIHLRRTVVRDLDGTVHIVPNGQVRVASNLTKEWARVNFNISVGYGTDLDHAIEVINRVCAETAGEPYWDTLVTEPPYAMRVDNLGDSGIDIKIVGKTKPMKQWEVMGELRKRIKKAFDEEGIEIPWPHTKVYFGDQAPKPKPQRKGKKRPKPSSEIVPPDDGE